MHITDRRVRVGEPRKTQAQLLAPKNGRGLEHAVHIISGGVTCSDRCEMFTLRFGLKYATLPVRRTEWWRLRRGLWPFPRLIAARWATVSLSRRHSWWSVASIKLSPSKKALSFTNNGAHLEPPVKHLVSSRTRLLSPPQHWSFHRITYYISSLGCEQ